MRSPRPHRPGQVAALLLSLSVALATGVTDRAHASPGPYRALGLSGPGSVARLRARLGGERFADILKLNRLDLAHAGWADTLVIPDSALSLIDLAPWPRTLAGLDTMPKLLLISLRIQAFAAYENARLVRWGPVSSGGPQAPSLPGLYFANWKASTHVSSIDSTWIMPWTVNIEAKVGTAIHEYALPGRPASRCCIRVLEDDARWIYDWVSTWVLSRDEETILARGTPVILFGEYDFSAPPPWTRLAVEPDATRLDPDEIAEALSLPAGSR